MKTHLNDENRYFSNDFVVQQEGLVRLMVRTPDEAVLQVWRHDLGKAGLEGTHIVQISRKDLDSPWEPDLFEGRPDWWLLGTSSPGTRDEPAAAAHPILKEALDAATTLLSDNDAAVLELGASRLRRRSAAIRETMRASESDRGSIDIAKRSAEHAQLLAERQLMPRHLEGLRRDSALQTFGFGGTLETEYGPVLVHIASGPVVRIECHPLVPLLVGTDRGPVELRLDARKSQGGWDYVKPKSDEMAPLLADEIYREVERLWPAEMKAALAAWASSSFALEDRVRETIMRKNVMYDQAARALDERAEAAEERLSAPSSSPTS